LVSSIGENAFEGCESLALTSLPKVTSIGESAFDGCASLGYNEESGEYILTIRSTLDFLGMDVFFGCNANLKVHVNSETYEKYGEDYEGILVEDVSLNP